MYNPPRFKVTDRVEAFELMDRYPFATVVASREGETSVSHLPLTPVWEGEDIHLIGHLARANPQWKSLLGSRALAIFHGPHTYVTPQWYPENGVPTWNYLTVHASGPVEVIEDDAKIVDCLKVLTAHVERHWPSGWEFELPPDLAEPGLHHKILAFRVRVDDLNFKKKLHQAATPANRSGVLRGLEAREDDNSREILSHMRKLYSADGDLK